MAGNTKLMGFAPDGTLTLARWGEQVSCKISLVSIGKIRKLCYEALPMSPPRKSFLHASDFVVEYQEDTGRVRVDMSIGRAEELVDIGELMTSESVTLRGAVEDHHKFHETENEPGVGGDGQTSDI